MAKEEKEEKDKEKESNESAEGEDSSAGEAVEESKKKLSKKMLIILAVAAVLVIGGGTTAGLYFAGVFGHKEGGEEQKKVEKEGKPVFFSLGDILVNLSGEGKRLNYLKLKVSLELTNEKDVPVMETLKPRIIDNFQAYLRELRVEDLRGSAGLYRLREELLMRVNETAHPVRVKDVLFQEMLIQ